MPKSIFTGIILILIEQSKKLKTAIKVDMGELLFLSSLGIICLWYVHHNVQGSSYQLIEPEGPALTIAIAIAIT